MKRYRLVNRNALSPEALAAAEAASPGFVQGDIDLDLLAGLLMRETGRRSRTKVRLELEEEMARAMERAIRGERSSFLDLYEFVPYEPDIGKTFKVRREPGPAWRAIVESFIWVEVDAATVAPAPLMVRDERSGTTNERLSPGGRVEILGVDLRFDPAAPDEGIFLVDAVDGTEFRLEGEPPPADANPNNMATARATLPPDLPSGFYRLECRGRVNGVLRTGALPGELRA